MLKRLWKNWECRAKLLHKHSMWESTQVLSIECDDSDDSEGDCDDENDANQQESKQEIVSSLIQEVCCDEPQPIAADIKNLIDNKVVDNSIHTVFENQHKLLSFKRLSSTTIPMYNVIDAENKKGTKNKQNFSPFVKIRSHEGTFFIRKTTAVWLLQESERVSSDRLFRVKCKQPFDCKLTSHLSTHKTPLSMLVESPSLPEKSPAKVSKVEQKDALVVSEAEQKDALVASEVGHMQKGVLVASEVLKMEEKDTLVASASIGVPKVEDKVAQNEQVIYVNVTGFAKRGLIRALTNI